MYGQFAAIHIIEMYKTVIKQRFKDALTLVTVWIRSMDDNEKTLKT